MSFLETSQITAVKNVEIRHTNIEGGETVEIPLRRATSASDRIEHLGKHSSSMEIASECRDFSNLNDDLQSCLADADSEQSAIRFRTNIAPKNSSELYPELNGTVNKNGSIPVDLVKEAAEIKLDKSYPAEPAGPVPGLNMNSTMFSEVKSKIEASVKSAEENSELLSFLSSNILRICVFMLILMIALISPLPVFLRGIIVGVYTSIVFSRFLHHMRTPSEEPVTHHWPEHNSIQQVPQKDLLKTDKVVYTVRYIL